jgi:DNA-binding MarR family transcriptional regulator
VGHPQESLTYLLQKAAKYSLLALEAALADLDLSARQYLLLALVATDDAQSQQDLAARLGLDPTILLKLVDQLEDRGLLTRTRFANDRRQHRLALTSDGARVLAEANARQLRAEKEFTRALGSRRAELRALLAETISGERLPGSAHPEQ